MAVFKNIGDKLFQIKQKMSLEKELKRLEEQYAITKKFPEYGASEDENAQEVEKFQENLGLQRNLKNLLRDTKAALRRIESGKYGLCEVCRQSIEPGRIKVYPAATLCVSCAAKKFKK